MFCIFWGTFIGILGVQSVSRKNIRNENTGLCLAKYYRDMNSALSLHVCFTLYDIFIMIASWIIGLGIQCAKKVINKEESCNRLE